MKEQNFKNHGRLIFLWHGFALLAILAVIIGSFVNLFHADADTHYSAALIVVIAFILAILWAYARLFALKAQDRAIRAEENFRHFILTGKPLDNNLTMPQIIALRFASDAEFEALAIKAAKENLSQKQIKQAVSNWRADHNRV